MKRSVHLIILLLTFSAFDASAQQKELKFKNFTQEDGLPSNECYAVFRDSRNYTWISTDQGVVRFSGTQMEHFSLPDNVVFKIREDKLGRIWFFSHTGRLSYFLNGTIFPYQYNDSIAKNAKALLITDAYVDDDGSMLINSAGGEYANYDISAKGEIHRRIFLDGNAPAEIIRILRTSASGYFARKELSSEHTDKMRILVNNRNGEKPQEYDMIVPPEQYNHLGCINFNGNLYVFAGRVLFRLNADGTVLKKEFPSDILSLQSSGANIWVGMIKNGAVLLDKELKPLDGNHLFTGLSITSVTVDYEGGTWFASLERGVFYLKNILVYNLRGDSALMQPVSRLLNVNDSVLLFTNEMGVHRFSHGKVSTILHQQNDNVSDLIYEKRLIYLSCKSYQSSWDYVATKFAVRDPLADTVMVIKGASELRFANDKLYSIFGHLLLTIDPGKPAPGTKNSFYASPLTRIGSSNGFMYFDEKEKGWFGTNNGLYQISAAYDSVEAFKPSSPLFQKGVTQMRQMANGLYAIGLRFDGVVLMRDTAIITHITEAGGLLSNSIKFILPLGDQLWVATAKGISVIHFQSFHPLQYSITNIGKNESFSNLVINQLVPYQGNILAATGNGIYVIEKPELFLDRRQPEIPFYINKLTYYKGDTSGISSISVPYNKNRLKISFNAISFNAPEEIKYYYRFDKGDTAWQAISGTELLLENLSPGIYDLELRAGMPNQQRFSAIQKFGIIVKEAWWQNNWLKAAAILILISMGFIFYKKRIRAITQKANLRTMQKTKMLELEQTALRSQMNPHFIFNSLTSIQQLIVNNKAEEANEHLVKFARLIRKTLELSARPYIRIAEEKEYLQEYLGLEQLRIPGEFYFAFEIDEKIDTYRTEIPNMMLQPIVENCIRHGIKHLENRKGLITIKMELTATVIRCTITDNGIGRNHTDKQYEGLFVKQKSYGMEIVRKRLELLPGAEQRNVLIETDDLQNEDGTPAGTKVSIQLPYKMISE